MSEANERMEEQQPAAAGVNDASLLSPDHQTSPQGMKLRSGKKKRRRSRETTGLTPPGEVEKKRRRMNGKGEESSSLVPQNGDRDDNLQHDHDMHSDEYDDDEDSSSEHFDPNVNEGGQNSDDHLKMPAAANPAVMNGSSNPFASADVPPVASLPTRTGESVAVATSKQLQPLPNLRIPSEQTPGRPVVTERLARQGGRVEPARRLHFDEPSSSSSSMQLPPALRQQASQQSYLSGFGANRGIRAGARRTEEPTENISSTFGSLVEPSSGQLQAQGGIVDAATVDTVIPQQEHLPNNSMLWIFSKVLKIPSYTAFWLITMLFIQIRIPFVRIPIMTAVTNASKMPQPVYNYFFDGSHEKVSENFLPNSTTLSNTTNVNVSEHQATATNITTGLNNSQTPSKLKTSKVQNVTKQRRDKVKQNRTKPKKEKPLPIIIPRPKLPPKKRKVYKYVPAKPNPTVAKLGTLTEQVDRVLVQADMKSLSLEISLASARDMLNKRKTELLAWSSALSAARLTLEHLASLETRLVEQFVNQGQQSIDNVQLSSKATLENRILNTTALLFWIVSVPNCSSINLTKLVDALVSSDEIEATFNQLKATAHATVASAVHDPEVVEKVRTWLQGRVSQEMRVNETAIEFLDKLAAEHGVGLSMKSVHSGIQSRLEVANENYHGQVDYASISNAAVVVRRGVRATSPSLVDSLPLLNRFMHYSGFRFYGHGPEAALTPTMPPNSLGQCWAVDNTAKGKCPDPFCGSLATLTIKFKRPVQVSGLVVEHSPRRTSGPSSAVREFRITGFDDKRAWPFGSFVYDVTGRSSQLFTITPIFPAIREITLAIDTNWGSPYTCLYRFRVHGEARDP